MGTRFIVGRGAQSQGTLGETVAGDYFETMGVAPAVGRLLEPSDEAQPVAVIGNQLWRDRFHADPAIAGKTVWIENQPVTIVGVAPAAFHGMMAPWSTEVWATPALHPDMRTDRRVGWLEVVGHLKSGVSRQQAAAAMNSLDRHLDESIAMRRTTPDPLVLTRPGLASSPVWNVFLVMSALLMAVVGIIYLIACANVAGLLIARAAARRRETLIRLSLGVSRPRLIRQLLTESLLLGILGAAAGTALAYVAGNALAAVFPRSISHGFAFQHTIDLSVLAWTLALALASVVFAGLLPAMRASRENLAVAGRTHGGLGDRAPRLRQGLIVAQVAASVLVLATAGVFVRSFQKSHELKPGFDAAHLLTVDLDLNGLRYSRSQTQELYRQVKEAVAGMAGIESASLADVLPLGDEHSLPIPNVGNVATAAVDADYFRTFGIPLVQGREPRREDGNVSVINQALANRWKERTAPAIGETVAVAANSKYWSLAESPRPFVYRITSHFDRPAVHLAVRTKGPAADFALAVSQAIQRLNPDLPAIVAQTGEERLRAWIEPQRAAALLLGSARIRRPRARDYRTLCADRATAGAADRRDRRAGRVGSDAAKRAATATRAERDPGGEWDGIGNRRREFSRAAAGIGNGRYRNTRCADTGVYRGAARRGGSGGDGNSGIPGDADRPGERTEERVELKLRSFAVRAAVSKLAGSTVTAG